MHLAIGGQLVVAHHQYKALALIGTDGAIGDQHHAPRTGRSLQPHARKEARREASLGIVEQRTHAHRATRHVDIVVDELEFGLVREAALVDESDLDRQRLATARRNVFQEGAFVGFKGHVDGVDRNQRGQHG